MSNPVTRNPRNMIGRNSGVGPGGIDAVIPTYAESRRGLAPFDLDDRPSWRKRIGAGLGILALLGGGAVALARRHRERERQRSMRGRVERLLPWK